MSERGFYVGYLALPREHGALFRVLVPALMLVMLGLGIAVGAAQRSPGSAVWDTSREIALRGVLLHDPYPLLIDSEGHTHLIVEVGKQGPREAIRRFVGAVELRGWLLERGGISMIELRPDASAIASAPGVAVLPEATQPGEAVELFGEVLDSKCYLGAMKPGDGKGHKACATLCVEGGIPPMFYATRADGGRSHFLLTTSAGQTARGVVLAYIGEPVRVRGTLDRIGDLPILRLEAGGVTRR